MKQRSSFRLLTLQSERQIAMVCIRRLGSNVIRLRAVSYAAMRHLALNRSITTN